MDQKMKIEDLEMIGAERTATSTTLCRSLSLRAPDPSSQLAQAYRGHDLETFTELLTGSPPEVDADHWYDEPNFATMLDLACRDEGRAEYVRVLLAAGADPNRLNRVRKKAPIHLAAEAGSVAALEVLLANAKVDVNKQDNTGCTALHLAAKGNPGGDDGGPDRDKRYRRCVQLLMEHPQVDVNKPNRKGLTPVHMAASHASSDMVRCVLAAGGSRLDVDSFEDASGETARQAVAAKHPQLVRLLPPRAQPGGEQTNGQQNVDRLFFYLYSRESNNFVNALAGLVGQGGQAGLVDSDDGSHTLLQLASEAGLQDAVVALLENGADPNRRGPLHAACQRGYYRVARALASHPLADLGQLVNGETVLHAAVKGAVEGSDLGLAASTVARDHRKCVQVVLAKGVDVNAADVKGNTALHYAARNGDLDVVAALLRNGAYIGARNAMGEPPLADLSPRSLEAYLDECVATNDLLPREDNYEVVLRYGFLAGAHGTSGTPRQRPGVAQVSVAVDEDAKRLVGRRHGTSGPVAACETDPLLYMSKSADLRYLLKHPIITSFLYLKWHRIRAFFYINLAFYVAFWALLTAYVLTGYSEHPEQGLLIGSPDAPLTSNGANATKKGDGAEAGSAMLPALLPAILGLFLLLLALRELFQLIVSPSKYVSSPENWMEAMLIVVTAVLLLSRQANWSGRQQLSAIAILLSWAELVLLIGRHPLLATNIEMFKTVSLNFLKFLAWYSILIVAFALSFYTLFRDCGGGGCKEDAAADNFFLSPGMSIFKSIVMLTGEFDAGSIPFVSFPGTSHVLFVLFVFLIAIVLFNLLNGLAVSDTQAIREDAELVAYVSRVKLVAYVESMLAGDSRGALHGWLHACHTLTCLKTLSARVNLFPDVIPDQQIHVLPNQANRIEFSTLSSCSRNKVIDEDDLAGSCAAKCQQISMDPTIMRDVKELFLRRSTDTEVNQMQKMIDHYKEQLHFYAQRIEHLEKSEKTLLDLLKSK